MRRGLLKSEELHAQWRGVSFIYGKRGRAGWRDFRRQMSSASCLMLVLAAIIYWQICEIQRAIEETGEEEPDGLRLDLLSHVSPVGWERRDSLRGVRLAPDGRKMRGEWRFRVVCPREVSFQRKSNRCATAVFPNGFCQIVC